MKNIEKYLKEDQFGYYLDFTMMPGVRNERFENLTIKYTLEGTDWYELHFYIKKLGKKTASGSLAKRINKLSPGSAMRCCVYLGNQKRWWVTEKGLHLATDMLLPMSNFKSIKL